MKALIDLPENISRSALMKAICDILCAEPLVSLKDLCRFKHGNDEHTNGLYAIYNRRNEILYVGKVGCGETSAYDRIQSHLSSDTWVDDEGSFRFRQFESLQEEQLVIAERLAIQYFRPPCNDLVTTQDRIDRWWWVL